MTLRAVTDTFNQMPALPDDGGRKWKWCAAAYGKKYLEKNIRKKKVLSSIDQQEVLGVTA